MITDLVLSVTKGGLWVATWWKISHVPAITANDAHAATAKLGIREITRQLNNHLGPSLVAVLAKTKDRRLPIKWAKPEGPQPRPESVKRLTYAHRVWTQIAGAESDHVARLWFIGANPRLEEVAPVTAIRDGRFGDVSAAANAFVEDASNL